VDNVGTLLRTIQYKGRTASLIIKVVQLSGVQKQVLSGVTDSLLFSFCRTKQSFDKTCGTYTTAVKKETNFLKHDQECQDPGDNLVAKL